MKLNKTFGRIATTLVATAMLASMAVVPASAVEDEGVPITPVEPIDPGVSIGETFTITKHLQVGQNSFTPTKQFNFLIAPANENVDNEKLTDEEIQAGIEYGVVNGVDTVGHALIEADPNEAVAGEDGKTVDVESSNITVYTDEFEHAGRYKYIVTEQSFDDDDFSYDDNKLVLYVNIVNGDEGLEVSYIELLDPDADGETDASKKIDGFTNEYGVDNDGDDKLHDVTLIKEIKGDQANMDAEFAFTVSVVSQYGNNTLLIVDTNGDGKWGNTVGEGDNEVADEVYSLKADGTTQTIYLGNGEQAKIFNLTEGSSYTIVENDANKNGYSTSVRTNKADEEVPTNGTVSADKVSEDLTITYINTKTSVTPTGLVMDIAPYVLLVVVAAAGCFVFLRKRRED